MHEKIPRLFGRSFLISLLIVSIWINASEIFRYFVFVMPMIRDAFDVVPNVAPINLGVFLSWMVWDSILIVAVFGFVWIYLDRFGDGWRNSLSAGTLIWLAIFGILWLGLLNLNLATFAILAVALPLSWLELVVSAFIIGWGRKRFA